MNEDLKEAREAAYLTMQEACGIATGDKVRIIRRAETREMGWCNSWSGMLAVGSESIVSGDCDSSGITLSDGRGYPFFCLELVNSALPKPVFISSEYSCEFNHRGGIKVGCQSLSFEKIEEIYKAAKSIVDK